MAEISSMQLLMSSSENLLPCAYVWCVSLITPYRERRGERIRVPELAHGIEHLLEFLEVVNSLNVDAARLTEELEGLGRARDVPPPLLIRRSALDQLVRERERAEG
jgi:hypothetical protein